MSILSYFCSSDDFALPALPPALRPWRPVLLAWLLALLDCFSRGVSRSLVRRFPQHPLVRLHALYDPAAVVQACARYHHQAGPGPKPTYPVALLVRAEIVRTWAGSCSDLKLEQLLASDLIARWFCGLALFDPSPDHTTLNRFHRWLAAHQPRALFADVLAFLDQVDPEDPRTTPQIADTFALASPATPTGPALLLLRLCQQLVTQYHEAAPRSAPLVLSPLDLRLLAQFPPLYSPAQRTVALAQAVALATALSTAIRPTLPHLTLPWRTVLQAQIDLLTKVVADETTTAADGQVVERPNGAKGPYRLGSATDHQATFRRHDPKPTSFGYNPAIATTTTRIRAAVVLDGCCPDSAAPVALLAQQQQAALPLPEKLIMDQAAGHGKTRAAVASCSGGQTQMVARTPQAGSYDARRFGGEDFTLSGDGTRCTCPNGVTSDKVYRNGAGDGVSFRFTAKQCAACPLWGQCRAPQSKPTSHRTVYISPYLGHLRAAAAFNQSPAGKALLGERWRVEPTVAWLTRYDGCRRARRVGKRAAQLQLYQACAVRNLWRWLARVAQGHAPLPDQDKGVARP